MDINTLIEPVIRDRLLKLVREYMVLGGMPVVLEHYFSHLDLSECQNIQTALLNTYRQDFGKYAKKNKSSISSKTVRKNSRISWGKF